MAPRRRYHRPVAALSSVLMFHGPHCGRALEAAEHYVAAFDDAEVLQVDPLPAASQDALHRVTLRVGDGRLVTFDSAIEHAFSPSPSLSLWVDLAAREELERASLVLSEGGQVLMPLQAYDFAPLFAWVQDRYGFSWQLNLTRAHR